MSSSTASTLSFSSRSGALFTADEVRDLMAVEFARSQRYRYPVVCLMIGIDRLASLETYYGRAAGELILEQIGGLIQGETRASDFLGCRIDDRLLALFPHTTAKAGAALARRILEGARELDVRMGQRPLRISLSIGLSHTDHGTRISFPTLLQVAEDGMQVADGAGGDRFVETELYQLHERALQGQEEPAAEEAPAERRVARELQDAEDFEARARSLAEEILTQALARMGEGGASLPAAEAAPVDEELLASRLAEREAELVREARDHERRLEEKEATYRREIENLQRRVAKLSRSLESTEGELRRVASLKQVDTGLASIYREVQGLDPGDSNAEAKQEMMSAIFQANLAMQKRSA